MSLSNMPTIRLELEGMKYQIIHAFESHNTEIEKAVAQELEKVIEEYPFEQEVSRIAGEVLSQAIEASLKEFMIYGDGRKRLREIIDVKLRNLFGEE